MKVVRIKVKTIIVSIFILFFTIPYIFYMIGVLGFESRDSVKFNISTYTSGFLKIYENYPTMKIDMGKVYYILGMSNYDYMKEILYFYSNGMTLITFKSGNMEQALIAKSYFEKGITIGQDDIYYVRNLNALINLEMALGNNEKAYELIREAKNSKFETVRQVALINEIVYYGKTGEYDKAIELCEENIDYIPLLEYYKDSINYLKGDFDKIEPLPIEKSYTDEEINENQIKARKNSMLISADILKDIDFIKDVKMFDDITLPKDIDFAKVTGKVMIKGKGIPNIKVFINEEWSGIGINSDGRGISTKDNYTEGQTTYTDENGEYVFENIFPGKTYEIIVAIPSVFADNVARVENSHFYLDAGDNVKVDVVFNDALNIKDVTTDYENDEIVVKYDKVKDADSYGLMLGIDYYGTYTGKLVEGDSDEIKIPLTKGSLQSCTMQESTEDESGNMILAPEYYIGEIDEKQIRIQVVAYDKDGNIISRSISSVKSEVKKKKLSEGEKLILDGKLDEGYNWLNERLKEEPMNKEYIYPIMRIAYERGNIEFCDELIDRLEQINGTGFDKAMKPNYERE